MSPSDPAGRNAVPHESDLVDAVSAQIGARTLLPLNVINSVRIRGVSVVVPDTQLQIDAFVREVDDAGSFPAGSGPLAVVMTIYPFPAGMTLTDAIREGASTAIPDAEAEAWLRVVLGDELADYAYHLPTNVQPRRNRPTLHEHQQRFASFIDRHGRHILAPDNFRWRSLSQTSDKLPRKIEPSRHSTELTKTLVESGPFADAEAVRDLRTDPDGNWRIQLAGDDLDQCTPIAREAIEQAYRQFRHRGAIHTSLRPERLIATPHEVQLHFRWKQNPNTIAITAQLPQAEADFQPPAADPATWMSYKASDWTEELSTGWVRWARRTRISGVIHLGRRHELACDDYFPEGSLRPRPGNDGLISIPYGDNLTLDQTATYRANQLIDWNYELDIREKPNRLAAHAVIVWTDTPNMASLDILDALPATPEYSVRRAAFNAIHNAADAGAHLITTTLTTPVLDELGFVTDTTGRRVLDVLTMP